MALVMALAACGGGQGARTGGGSTACYAVEQLDPVGRQFRRVPCSRYTPAERWEPRFLP
jgi:hypothetical protein